MDSVYKTGELEIRHPALGARAVRWNRRRQDMPNLVVAALEKIERHARLTARCIDAIVRSKE